jgi:hypothetical protein
MDVTRAYRPGDLVVTHLADGPPIYAEVVDSSDDPEFVTFRATIDGQPVQATVVGDDIRTLITTD